MICSSLFANSPLNEANSLSILCIDSTNALFDSSSFFSSLRCFLLSSISLIFFSISFWMLCCMFSSFSRSSASSLLYSSFFALHFSIALFASATFLWNSRVKSLSLKGRYIGADKSVSLSVISINCSSTSIFSIDFFIAESISFCCLFNAAFSFEILFISPNFCLSSLMASFPSVSFSISSSCCLKLLIVSLSCLLSSAIILHEFNISER